MNYVVLADCNSFLQPISGFRLSGDAWLWLRLVFNEIAAAVSARKSRRRTSTSGFHRFHSLLTVRTQRSICPLRSNEGVLFLSYVRLSTYVHVLCTYMPIVCCCRYITDESVALLCDDAGLSKSASVLLLFLAVALDVDALCIAKALHAARPYDLHFAEADQQLLHSVQVTLWNVSSVSFPIQHSAPRIIAEEIDPTRVHGPPARRM